MLMVYVPKISQLQRGSTDVCQETATHGTVEVPGCEDGLATVFKKGRPEADMAPSQVEPKGVNGECVVSFYPDG